MFDLPETPQAVLDNMRHANELENTNRRVHTIAAGSLDLQERINRLERIVLQYAARLNKLESTPKPI